MPGRNWMILGVPTKLVAVETALMIGFNGLAAIMGRWLITAPYGYVLMGLAECLIVLIYLFSGWGLVY